MVFIVLLFGSIFYFRYASAPPAEVVAITPLPTPVEEVLLASGLRIENNQPTTLRWVATSDENVTVNLSAQSYGLGFMTKSKYEELNKQILEVTTPEITNNASSTIASQSGFRVGDRACIIGFTYADSGMVGTEEGKNLEAKVYSIIICSRGN